MYQNPDGYDLYMGRWSARLAPPFLDFCGLDAAGRYLDVGCGTGSLTKALRARLPDAQVIGLDRTWDFIAHLHRQAASQNLGLTVGDALHLPFADASFDAALGLLILQQLPDPPGAVAELRRATRAGGTVATATWDFQGGMPMISVFMGAVRAVAPAAAAKRDAKKRRPAPDMTDRSLAELWRACGLADVETATLEVALTYAGLDDYWTPFLSGATPTSALVADLTDETRAAVKAEAGRRLLADRRDGPFALAARAFAVRGRVPSA